MSSFEEILARALANNKDWFVETEQEAASREAAAAARAAEAARWTKIDCPACHGDGGASFGPGGFCGRCGGWGRISVLKTATSEGGREE